MFDEQGLLSADFYIVPAASVESYRDSFRALDPAKISAEGLRLLELDGQPCGILVWDGEKGSAASYLDYGEGEYYLFLGANSLHAGERDDAAYELLGELLRLP